MKLSKKAHFEKVLRKPRWFVEPNFTVNPGQHIFLESDPERNLAEFE
jgi:hypothetical protein